MPQVDPPSAADLRVDVASSLAGVTADAWNALVPARYPFLRYAFLRGLEQHGCLGERFGWLPQHLLMRDARGRLVAAAPLYLKFNSYGEFVFDWSWADAYRRAGLEYYPKLVSASPYTPATGPKLLCAPDAPADTRARLVEAGLGLARELRVSSLHWLFTTNEETDTLEDLGFARRLGCQFHWDNRGYRDFADFLGSFSSAKRKKVLRERRRVSEQHIELRRLHGGEAGEAHWATFHRLYESTFDKRGGLPTLSLDFFLALAEQAPETVLLVAAYAGPRMVAAAFDLVGEDSLYGRHWGCFADYHSLHFEACYYQGLDYCIERGLARFEPGAQGEHKISRGFMPTATWSAHWLANPGFATAVGQFLEHETEGMREYMRELAERSPYRSEEPAG
ncbi:MAG: GNAT family N-acetyltransferase [Gammaproteobacteria bacterium]